MNIYYWLCTTCGKLEKTPKSSHEIPYHLHDKKITLWRFNSIEDAKAQKEELGL